MKSRIFLVALFSIAAIAAGLLTPRPAESCNGSFSYSYDDSRAQSMGGSIWCGNSGGGCIESGQCDGSAVCVVDIGSGNEYCIFEEHQGL